MSIANGTPVSNRLPALKASKPRTPRAAKPATSTAAGRDATVIWAKVGIGGTLVLSAGLNGLAFAESASIPALGWVLGITIPALVLVLSRVAAGAWNARRKLPAGMAATACVGILALSIQHLAQSIAAITGEHWFLAGLMAVAIDVGLVACELVTVKK